MAGHPRPSPSCPVLSRLPQTELEREIADKTNGFSGRDRCVKNGSLNGDYQESSFRRVFDTPDGPVAISGKLRRHAPPNAVCILPFPAAVLSTKARNGIS